MPYIAGQRLTINGEYREGGEPVPEAETEQWRTINDLVATGHLVWVDEAAATEPEPTPTVYRPPQPAPTEPGPQDEAVVAAREAEDVAAAKELAANVAVDPPPPNKPATRRKRSR